MTRNRRLPRAAVIRRELSFNMCFYNPRYASLDALPEWAKKTLDAHRHDRRKPLYTHEELERAATHDEVWNLAQRQLLACGTIHNYLRMLWGKKIIEWSETPEDAHRTMVAPARPLRPRRPRPQHPRRHPLVLRQTRPPLGPRTPDLRHIRWMSSAQTAKKVRLREVEAAVAGCEPLSSVSQEPPLSLSLSPPR